MMSPDGQSACLSICRCSYPWLESYSVDKQTFDEDSLMTCVSDDELDVVISGESYAFCDI